MSEPFIGEIRTFPFQFAPRGWLCCDGQMLPISEFMELFSLIGTTYGGDGRSNFVLPNLQSRAVIGAGFGPGLPPTPLGWPVGANEVTLMPSNLPAHQHASVGEVDRSDSDSPSGSYVAIFQNATGLGVKAYVDTTTEPPSAAMAAETLSDAGGGRGHENRQPFLTLRFCIAATGVYPPRN